MSSAPPSPSRTSPLSTPSNSTSLPPATPPAPPPSNSKSPPTPARPSVPPPAPSIPSTPARPSVPPPAPSTPSTPATPSKPSPPATPSKPSPPAPRGISPPSIPSPPPPSKTPPSAKSPPSPPSPSAGGGISTIAVVVIAAGAVGILVVLIVICVCCRKRRKIAPPVEYYGGPPPPLPPAKDDPYGGQLQNWKYDAPSDGQPQNWQHNSPTQVKHAVEIPSPLVSYYSGSEISPSPSPGFTSGFSRCTFTFEELAMATNGFSDANLIGEGGFGYVHRGVLPDGKEVAIKQLKSGSGQGEREFQAEVEIISCVHHRHLVSLVGYCISGDKRLLVYEYVPNKTLELHLHGKDRPTMEWNTRLKIALGSAKGLAYLHEDCQPKIIHRDIKAANILLDYKFDAKVSDFGLAKFSSGNDTHVSTRVMGTVGYLAPEYASSGKLTDKSDVFSYGVMLLELITGKRPVDTTNSFMDDSLVDWARPLLTRAMEDGNYDALIDPRLGRNYNPNEMARMVACAASCVRHSARRRPRMAQIVRALEGDASLEDLNQGSRPGRSTHYGSCGSPDYGSGQYIRNFREMAIVSRDYTSSKYSAPTSELLSDTNRNEKW